MVKHKGFTFIEIALFLAVTAALFIGIALGMQNSIFRQQYDDSVQNFLEFMRSIYSQVSNTQSPGTGDSNYAVYGKLIVFGETKDMLGEAIDITTTSQQIYTYDVIGNADSTYTMSTGKATVLLKNVGANVVFIDKNNVGLTTNVRLATPEKYEPRWGAGIQNPDRTPVNKSILVVRHPRAGTINTLVMDEAIQVNAEWDTQRVACTTGGSCTISNLLTQYLGTSSAFRVAEVDFCVNPYGLYGNGALPRQNIRILENARNASSVQMIDMDGGDNHCV